MPALLSEGERTRLSALIETIHASSLAVPVLAHLVGEIRALTEAKVAIAFRLRPGAHALGIHDFHVATVLDGCCASPAEFERLFASTPGGFASCLRASANLAGRAQEVLGTAKHCREFLAALGVEDCDALRVTIDLEHAHVAWIGVFRRKSFTCREAFLLESLVAPLRARISPEEHASDALRSRAALSAALAAIPAAAFLVDADGAVEDSNERAHELMEHDSTRLRKQLRSAVANPNDHAAFAITPLAVNEGHPRFLAIERDASASVEVRVARAANTMQLSDRQVRVLSRLARGSSNKVIAESIGCSTKTVEVHVLSLLRKFGVKNRAELVAHFWTKL